MYFKTKVNYALSQIIEFADNTFKVVRGCQTVFRQQFS
jgi:hypothetical protein